MKYKIKTFLGIIAAFYEVDAIQIDKRMDFSSPEWWANSVKSNTVILHGMGKYTRDIPTVTIPYGHIGHQGDWVVFWDSELYIIPNKKFMQIAEKIE